MWEATITNIQQNTAETVVTVEYSNGTESFSEITTTNGGFGSAEQLNSQIAAKIKRLNNEAEIRSSLTLGKVSISEEAPAAKTQAQIDSEVFFADYQKLSQAKKAIELGIIDVTDEGYIALSEKVKSEFKPEYLNLI